MNRPVVSTLFAAALLAPGSALAGERTVTLAVDNMSCVTCPYIVKKALGRVAGVMKVNVSFAEKRAVVTFDEARASVAALTSATAQVGFPSRPEARTGAAR